MRISAKADYAVRAAVEIAARDGTAPVTREELARGQAIPTAFLANILTELDQAGVLHAQRGRDGGYRLARPASTITVADVLRAVEGPLTEVQGDRPETLSYDGAAKPLPELWVAVRASVRSVLENVTLDEIAHDHLPADISRMARADDA